MSAEKPNALEAWVAAAAAELGLVPGDDQTGLVLDLARDVAHGVLRPGAPVTAYLLGVAVGRGADPADAARRLSALALSWRPALDGDTARPRPALDADTARPRPAGGNSVADPPAP